MSPVKGVYVLIISIGKDVCVSVGALGFVNFEKGYYTYVGSAQNGLEKRVKRHLRRNKRKFWHIDYLLDNPHTKVVETFYKENGKQEECRVAKEINKMGTAIKGFGCSDCKCESHLIKLELAKHRYLRGTSMAMKRMLFPRTRTLP
jgi:Uri superfamily endonuclease